MSVFELTLSTARLREALARKGLSLDQDATFRLVADPAAGTLGVELPTDPRAAAVVQDVKVRAGQYL